MLIDQWATAQGMLDTFDGYSADEIENMPMADYARLRARAGLPAVDPFEQAYAAYDAPQQADTVSATEAAQANAEAPQSAPQGVDVGSLTMEQYGALRSQLGVGGREYGVGVMNSGAGTNEWVQAARSRVGRTKYGQSNVQDAARPDSGKYLAGNEPVTGRQGFYR